MTEEIATTQLPRWMRLPKKGENFMGLNGAYIGLLCRKGKIESRKLGNSHKAVRLFNPQSLVEFIETAQR